MKHSLSNDIDLTSRILDIRYVDLNKEKELCFELLEQSEKKQYIYGRAFAYVYLFDSVLALGEYSECDNYLSQALYLCRNHGYDRLLMTLCNFAGLYYIRLNDEQTALQYFLEGIQIAEELQDTKTCGMLYNNIGLGFAGRDEWESAKELFHKAVLTVINENDIQYEQKIISYLSNFAESCLQVGEMNEAKKALESCLALKNEELYYKIRIGCEWISYYAKMNQREMCIQEAKKQFDLDIEQYDNKYFVCDMVENMAMSMLSIHEYEWAKKFNDMLERLVKDSPPVIRYRLECAKINYLEAIGANADASYKAYYEVNKEISVGDHENRLQSILSIIQLYEVTRELDKIQKENAALENVMQIDSLTGLYNRRYFNKITTKTPSIKEGGYVGIIMIDVDFFKQYNDIYGHSKGDEVLRYIGSLLRKNAITGISPCRYGGDEFVCYCQHLHIKDINNYVKAIYDEINQKQIVNEGAERDKYITLSIGYAVQKVSENLLVETLLVQADKALYKAKSMGRNTYYKLQDSI